MINPVDAAMQMDLARGQQWANLVCVLLWLRMMGWI